VPRAGRWIVRPVVAAAAALTLLLTACSEGGGAKAGTPTTHAGGAPTSRDFPASPGCREGRAECVDATINTMSARLSPLADACDHNAIFALNYLRITEEYRRTIQDARAFADVSYVSRLDALFAEFYFSAYDNWAAGRTGDVAPAWTIALDVARAKQVNGIGDALLGINAHINRDLPFVLSQIGLFGPDGLSRRGDFNKFVEVLVRAFPPMISEEAARFDPTMVAPLPGEPAVALEGAVGLITSWRDAAFRNAERLTAATTPAARAAATAEIEESAAATARSVQLAYTYTRGRDTGARDAFCLVHHG
jgi:hypothetical protein